LKREREREREESLGGAMAGGGGPEGQQEKKAAAEAYAYEKDPRWADYWSNVLIPQQHTGRPDVQRHFQLKFYQRYIVHTFLPLCLSLSLGIFKELRIACVL